MPTVEPEPEAEAPPPSQTQGTIRRSHRSCHLCNRRKVRCDKRQPCGPCSRAGKQCVYPPPGEPIRRPRKTTMADVALRVSTLEQSLASARKDPGPTSLASELAGVGAAPSPAASLIQPRALTDTPLLTSGASQTTPTSASRNGMLVEGGSTSQYINEVLLSRVIEEERDVQSLFASPHSRPSQLAVPSPFNPMGILSAPSSDPPSTFHPPKQAALCLWKLYLDFVENCSYLKIGHVPTMEIRIYATIEDPASAPLENLALSYAVYFATIISRGEEGVTTLLGGTKAAWLTQTKMGFEQALAHADFLDKPTLTGLHAMAIYLSALLVVNRGKANWVLNGLAIRIAQSLGIHCNGERFGLSPFESEMRRRLWWHLKNREGRSGEDYGLQSTNDYWHTPDARLPLNVDDNDLYPGMTELPREREGFTAMTFTLNQIVITNAIFRLAGLARAASATNPSLLPEDLRVQVIDEMKSTIGERLKHCNMIVPNQRHAFYISTYAMRKVDLITRQQWASLRCPGERDICVPEEDLAEAIGILELGVKITTDELLKPFSWASEAYPQYYALMYVLWHLYVHPEGPSVESAWRVVDTVLEKQKWDKSRAGFGMKSAVLEVLYAKARTVREKQRVGVPQAGTGVEGSCQDPTATDIEPGSASSWSFGPGASQGDTVGVLSDDGLPDWGDFVRGLQIESQGFVDMVWQLEPPGNI